MIILLSGSIAWLASLLLGLLAVLKDPSDLIVTVEAEDAYDFNDRLGEIFLVRMAQGQMGGMVPGIMQDLMPDFREGKHVVGSEQGSL